VKTQEHARGAVPHCRGRRFAIVAARFYVEIAEHLVAGAERALRECGVAPDDMQTYEVAGCFELPLACLGIIDSGNYDAVVALGAVVRGQTPHFDYVAGECARGIMDVQLATRTPIGFGVLTTETLTQAQERADPERGNKGYSAAMAAASLLTLSVSSAKTLAP
jgi:6,7-dimethyl-8-ribityllumazine synthase